MIVRGEERKKEKNFHGALIWAHRKTLGLSE